MRTSEAINELAAALAKAQASYTPVKKTKTGKIQGFSKKTSKEYSYEYKYADLADILQMALPILSANGLSFTQPHILTPDLKLRVVSRLMHSTGQWMESDGIEISEGGTPQEFGMESTYFRRYDGASLLGIAPDEDTDAQNMDSRKSNQEALPHSQRDQVQAQTRQDNARPDAGKPHEAAYNLVDTRLTIPVAAVEKKEKKNGSGSYLVVWPDGLFKGNDRLYVWDEPLFVHLLGKAQGKTCGFEIEDRTTKDKKAFVSIKKVLHVGEDVIGDPSKPYVSDDKQAYEDSDIPF